MEGIIERTPAIIAAEINGLKEQARSMVLSYSVAIGRRLIEAKALLLHGSWGDWLEQSVSYSQRTAQNLMRIAERFGGDAGLLTEAANSQALADLNLDYTKAVALLALPAEDMEAFAAEHDVEGMSSRELQEAIRERDEAKKQAEENLKLVETGVEAQKQLKEKLQEKQKTVDQLSNDLAEASKGRREIEAKLKKAQKNKEADKNIKDLEEKLADAERQVQELSDSLKLATKPDVVEIVPEEIKSELEELRDNKRKLESKITMMDPAAVKFRVHMESLQDDFSSLLSDLDAIGQQDGEKKEKCRCALLQLLNKMEERLS